MSEAELDILDDGTVEGYIGGYWVVLGSKSDAAQKAIEVLDFSLEKEYPAINSVIEVGVNPVREGGYDDDPFNLTDTYLVTSHVGVSNGVTGVEAYLVMSDYAHEAGDYGMPRYIPRSSMPHWKYVHPKVQ